VTCPLKLVAGVKTSDSPFTVTLPLSKSPMRLRRPFSATTSPASTPRDCPPARRQPRDGVEHRCPAQSATQPASQPRHAGRADRPLVHRSRDDREERDAITRVGCRTRQPGLRSLEHLDSCDRDDVVRRLIEVLRKRRRHWEGHGCLDQGDVTPYWPIGARLHRRARQCERQECRGDGSPTRARRQ
jgi:hypothetical protein